MKLKFIYATLALLLLFSCSVEDNLESLMQDNNEIVTYKVTQEEAQSIVQGFVDEMSFISSTRSANEMSHKEISSVYALRKNLIQTRSGADGNGFVLVAADKRTEPIFAIVDEGNFNFELLSEEDNDMFLTFLDYAISTELDDIENFSGNISQTRATSNGWTINTKYAPILKTKWSQGGENNPNSYGKYCPNKTTGCTVIATAQILSHFQTISHVNWSYNGVGASSDLHWSQIISDCENNNGVLSSTYTPQSLNEVAHLCRYFGIAFGAKYNSDGSTSVGEDKPIDWFNKWGGLKASKLKEYNESQIITSIKNGNPVYGRGNSGRKKFLGITVKYKDGHAWVYDGYISATKNGKQQNLIHCNWGWGSSKFYNGYYLSKVFDTNSGSEIYDNEVTRSGQSGYYKYNLEYSIISR